MLSTYLKECKIRILKNTYDRYICRLFFRNRVVKFEQEERIANLITGNKYLKPVQTWHLYLPEFLLLSSQVSRLILPVQIHPDKGLYRMLVQALQADTD